jgi:hypothetical protein
MLMRVAERLVQVAAELLAQTVAVLLVQPSIPTHDRDVVWMGIGAIALLVVGGLLVAYANRRKR